MVWFQDGCEKYLNPNQLDVMTVENILMNKESGVPTMTVIPNRAIDFEKGYYNYVYVIIHFKKDDYFNWK